MVDFIPKSQFWGIVGKENRISLATWKTHIPGKRNLAELAPDVFDSAGELLFADQGYDVCDAQSA